MTTATPQSFALSASVVDASPLKLDSPPLWLGLTPRGEPHANGGSPPPWPMPPAAADLQPPAFNKAGALGSEASGDVTPLKSALSATSSVGGTPTPRGSGGGAGMRRNVSWSDMATGAPLSSVVEYHPNQPGISPRSDGSDTWDPSINGGCACLVM